MDLEAWLGRQMKATMALVGRAALAAPPEEGCSSIRERHRSRIAVLGRGQSQLAGTLVMVGMGSATSFMLVLAALVGSGAVAGDRRCVTKEL